MQHASLLSELLIWLQSDDAVMVLGILLMAKEGEGSKGRKRTQSIHLCNDEGLALSIIRRTSVCAWGCPSFNLVPEHSLSQATYHLWVCH